MKFSTQHIRVANGHENYQLHREGNVTWETRGGESGDNPAVNVIKHTSVAAAKALFGDITSVSK